MSARNILIYAENYSGNIHRASYELLGKARELISKIGGEVYATIVTTKEDAEKHAKDLIAYGADKVVEYIADKSLLPNQQVHKEALLDAINFVQPKLVLIPATPWGRSLGPRVAAAIKTGITADCLDIYIDENGEIIQVRPAFTGNIIAHIKTLTLPVMATIRPGVFPPPKPNYERRGDVIVREMKLSPNVTETLKVLGVVRTKTVRLSDADVIVSVGKGLRSKEDVKLFEELAKELGGVLGCSKPLVDMGWLERDRQVGFSGNTVRPKLYIALGISGAPQHIAGMKDSQYVIAVNLDPSAPIAKYSDVFIIGDMYEFAKRLLSIIKDQKMKKS